MVVMLISLEDGHLILITNRYRLACKIPLKSLINKAQIIRKQHKNK